jgi:hypothetical protein
LDKEELIMPNYRKLLLLFFYAFFQICSISVVQAGETATSHKTVFYPTTGEKNNPVSLIYFGKSYGSTGLSLKADNKKQIKKDSLLVFLNKMHEFINDNDQVSYIKLWQERDRNKLQTVYKDNPDAWDKFNKLIKSALDYKVMKSIDYGDYTIAQMLYIQPNKVVYASSLTLMKVKESYLRTQDLQNDVVITYLTQIDAQKYVREYKEQLKSEIK